MRLRSMPLWSHKVSSRHSAVWMCKFRPLFQSEICMYMYMHTITPPQSCPSQNGCWWSLQCDWQIPHRHICREKAYWTKTNPFFAPRRESKHRGIWVGRQAGERERERGGRKYTLFITHPPFPPSPSTHDHFFPTVLGNESQHSSKYLSKPVTEFSLGCTN